MATRSPETESGRPADAEGFDLHSILRFLPHRYPFLLVDRVTEFVDGVRLVAVKNVSINEPYFAGHFPGRPVMPGVLICEALAQAGALLVYRSTRGVPLGVPVVLAGMDRVRFRHPVFPGDRLSLEVALARCRPPLFQFRGEARAEGRLVAEGEFKVMAIAAEGAL